MTDKEKFERLRMALEVILKTSTNFQDCAIARLALDGVK